MIYITDEVFNNLSWEPVDGLELGAMIEGKTIVGGEPTDYPQTSGYTLYLQDKRGNISALCVDTELLILNDPADYDYTPLYIGIAAVTG